MNGKNQKGAQVLIDTKKIKENFLYMAQQASPSIPTIVLKSDAYGMGLLPVAQVLLPQGIQHIFVSTLEEALILRSMYNQVAIYVLNGTWTYPLDILSQKNITPVLLSRRDIEHWNLQGEKEDKQLPAILQVDIGMGRFGLSIEEAKKFVSEQQKYPYIQFEFLLGHLSSASDPESLQNEIERQRFEKFRTLFPDLKSTLANSAGILLGKDYHYEMVRMAIALYGGAPLEKRPNPLQQAVTLQGRIVQIRDVKKGEKVGYDGLYVMPENGRIATLNIGFADGLPRALSNKGYAYIQGFKVPIAGRISMDWASLDVTHIPEEILANEQWATFIGEGIPVDEVASLASTTSYDILSRLSARVERIYI